MSVEQAKACVERMNSDEDFRARVVAAGDPAARLKLISAEGFQCTAEEIESLQELAELDLDAVVAGGFFACGQATPGMSPREGLLGEDPKLII